MKSLRFITICTLIMCSVTLGLFALSEKLQLLSTTFAQGITPQETHKTEGCTHYFELQSEDIEKELSISSPQSPTAVNGFDFPVGDPNGSGWLNNFGLNFLERYNYGGSCGFTYHPGVDLNKDGTSTDQDRYQPVYAVADGAVIKSAYYGTSTWGNVILIEHTLPNGTKVWSQYGHLKDRWVQDGAVVTKRQQIGRVGKGDGSLPAHLHFEIRKVSLTANDFPCGQNQTFVTDRYYDPINFVNQNRTLQQTCPISPGQGTSGSEFAAFNNAYNNGGAQIALGCPNASVKFDGFTSFDGTIGHYQTTERGEILYHVNNSRAGQAFAIENPLRTKWASYPFNNTHPLGYPTSFISQQTSSCNGTQNRYQSFERGSLSQHSGNVYEVHGAIHTKWQQRGFAGCPLGLPTSDETTAQPSGASGSTGKLNQFQGGQIYWRTGTAEAYEVHGSIYTTYVSPSLGGSAGWMGFPTSDEFVAPTGFPRSNFEGGYITWDGTTYRAFSYSTQCNYSISSTSQNLGSGSGSGSVSVTASSGCTWMAISNASWITITSGGSGNGNGTVNFSVAQNTGSSRTGTTTIAGRTFTVTQSGGTTSCSSPSAITFGQSINGNLQNRGCLINGKFYDAYTFNGTARQRIYITLSALFDTYLFLYRGNYPGGILWSKDDDGGGNRNSRIPAYSGYLTLPSTGTYTILASSYAPGANGNYTLSLDSVSSNTSIRNFHDFDSDGKTDYSIFRPSNGFWYFQSSTNGSDAIQFGISTDKIAPADYDGDGRTDIAVFREGNWYLLQSTAGYTGVQFGIAGDIPQPADYDGDGKDDIAVFRPSNGGWYLLRSTQGFIGVAFGISTDKPVAADYDGDGKTDIAVYRDGNWYLLQSSQGFAAVNFGIASDKPVPADFDGDGKADVCVFRASNGTWYRLNRSNNSFIATNFGIAEDKPAAGDYDGDGKADVAVWRPSNGMFYVQQSQAGFTALGLGQNGDVPVASAYVP